METLQNIVTAVDDFVWSWPTIILILGTGILVTIRTGVFQIAHIKHWFQRTIFSAFTRKDIRDTSDKHAISQWQSLCTAMSATIGTGNITGISYAIIVGGPGAIFWMWLAAFFGQMTNYSENLLGIFFRRKNANGEWSGGSMYFLRDGVGKMKYGKAVGPILGVLFAIFAIVASFGIGNMGQVISISEGIAGVIGETTINLPLIVGIFVAIMVFLVIIGGIKRISKVAEVVVPFMSVFYVIGAIIIIIMNAGNIGPAFAAIFKGAFNTAAAAGGIGGAIIAQAIKMGFKRGIFSNEAGLGSSVMVHSSSNVKEPVVQGMWGIFEVFFDTMIVCTMTALVILTSGLVDLETGASSGYTKMGLASEAFTLHLGTVGGVFLAIALVLFAFTTILGWSHYGTKAWEYLFGTKATLLYKILFVVAVILGSAADVSMAIDISDIFNALMAIPNLIGVICLSGIVAAVTKNYKNRVIKGVNEKPMLSAFPEIQEMQEKALAEEGD
jgi:AGCS family alanine or glycine:cation symporter